MKQEILHPKHTAPHSSLRVWVLTLCTLFCSAYASAQDSFDINGITYTTTSENTCSVTQGCDSAQVTIPQEVTYEEKSYTVTEIGKDAFYNYRELTSIGLPSTIKSIGNSAFYGCSSLQHIELPDMVSYIGSSAFQGCRRLDKINIPEGVTSIERRTFQLCSQLDSVTISNSVTTVGDYAFADCLRLNSIVVPKSVTTIGVGCFCSCDALKEIQVESENSIYQSVDGVLFNKDLTTLYCYPGGKEDEQYTVPNSVTTIDTLAFYGNSIIQKIQIPAATSRIKGNGFLFCPVLKAIEVTADNGSYQSVDGVLFDKNLNTLYVYPQAKEGTEYTIPSSVTSVGDYAFYCASLDSIKMSELITTIGKYAFRSCRRLSNIELPTSLISIGEFAFYGCEKINSIKIPESVTSINREAFESCYSLKKVEIRSSVATVGGWAFYGCDSLTSVVCYAIKPIEAISSFSNNIYTEATLYVPRKSIAVYQNSSYCWSKFQNIQPILGDTISESETELPATVYDDHGICYYISEDGVCSVQQGVNVAEVSIPQEITYSDKTYTVTEIGKEAFYDYSDLISVELPSTIKYIGERAFYRCLNLQNVEIPDSVSYIGSYAFYRCPITKAHIPNGVTSIEEGSFYWCSLDSLIIPNSVTKIGNKAFYYCDSLTTVKLSDSLTTIGDEAFYNCSGITAIEFPSSVTTIGNRAFSGCSGITAIEFPSSVTTIGDYAFCNTGVKSVAISKSITTIGEGCFGFCNELNAINVESGNSNFQSIDGVLFNKDLTTLYCYPIKKDGEQYIVPNSVTTIDTVAFYKNDAIQSIQIPAATSRIRGNVFFGCSKLNTIGVASDNSHYQSVDGVLFNKELNTLLVYPQAKEGTEYAIPSTVTSISEYAFYENTTLVQIKIPESVTNIGEYVFRGCYRLSSIELPSSLISIGKSAFSGCEKINSIKIPESVTSINQCAFQNCYSLKKVEIQSSVATIVSQAFANCDSLNDVICYATVPVSAHARTFSSQTYASATLYVPDASIGAYRNSSYCWNLFANIKPLSEYVADVNGNEGTGETEEPSGNDVTNIQGAEVVVPTFSLQGHTLYLSGAATVIRTDGTLVYVGNGPVALTPGGYFIRVAGETRKVMIP